MIGLLLSLKLCLSLSWKKGLALFLDAHLDQSDIFANISDQLNVFIKSCTIELKLLFWSFITWLENDIRPRTKQTFLKIRTALLNIHTLYWIAFQPTQSHSTAASLDLCVEGLCTSLLVNSVREKGVTKQAADRYYIDERHLKCTKFFRCNLFETHWNAHKDLWRNAFSARSNMPFNDKNHDKLSRI